MVLNDFSVINENLYYVQVITTHFIVSLLQIPSGVMSIYLKLSKCFFLDMDTIASFFMQLIYMYSI